MYIQSIRLQNFRNYDNAIIDLDPRMNIIYGNNAQGKTNILEAIYLCATSKSHRTNNSKELIQFMHDEAHIELKLIKDGIEEQIDFHLKSNNKKSIGINKMPIKKANELFGLMKVIMFSPEDLGLIKNGPKERRRFMDLELCQMYPLYYHYLKNYHHVLKQRNNLLKSIKKDPSLADQLEIWNIQLVEYGSKIIDYREKFIDQMNPYLKQNHFKISGENEELIMKYEKNCTCESFESQLEKRMKVDILMGSTTIGPHKDDIGFIMNELDIRKYGSQGQQRTAALSLKLAEIEFMKSITDEKPILLLDDVLSELDRYRQHYLISHIGEIQTIMTCTGIEDYIKNKSVEGKMFKINKGRIE